MKSNRGSITIFMLIIVPVLAIGIFLTYDYLNTYRLNNQVLKNTRNISEIQLSINNSHLFENYGVLAYFDHDIINNQMMAMNKQVQILNIEVKHHNLGNQHNFIIATKMASRNIVTLEAVNQVKALINPMLKSEQSSEIIERIKKFEKTVDIFFDFHDEVKKIGTLISSQNAEPILKSLEDEVNGKLQKTLISYEALLEKEMDFIGTHIQNYENLMNESIRKSEEWKEQIEELRILNGKISKFRLKVERIKSEIAQITIKIESIPEFDTELKTMYEELSILTIQNSLNIQQLLKLEEEWDNSIQNIITENKKSKPMIMDKIKQLTNRVDEMLFDLEPIENLTLPSNGLKIENDNTVDHTEINSIDGIIYVEYWLGVLKSFDQGSIRNFDPLKVKLKRDKVIKGEVEFLVGGKLSDPQNVQIVKMRIFALRIVANMLHIASDASKTSQISRTTAALPAPWNLVAYSALVTLWSSAEGYLDMIALYEGKGHHLIKKDDEWQLSFDLLMIGSIASVLERNNNKEVEPSNGKLFYQDYLRLMLYSQPLEITARRAMFLLDANLNNVSNKRFNLSQFSIGHEIDLSYKVKGIEDTQNVLSISNKY